MFVRQITSLKKLVFYWHTPNLIFTSYTEAKYCLKILTELDCHSDINSEIFYQLSQICYNIQSLTIIFEYVISSGLIDLISVQKNLKYFSMTQYENLENITSLMTKLQNTLIKLNLYEKNYASLSFIAKLTNLQELELSFNFDISFKDFEKLQYDTIFSQLEVLKIRHEYSRYELLIKFLENNGRNLKELYVGDRRIYNDNSLNLAISKFCPKLRILSTRFENNELETLKLVFNNCQYLESVKLWCGGQFLSKKEALEAVVKYSQNISELILYHVYDMCSRLLPEELKSFFINWTNRVTLKSLSLIIVNNDEQSLDANDENMEIIEKYIKLGIIKRFKVTDFDDEEFN